MYSSRRKSNRSYRKRVVSRKNKTRSKRKNLKFKKMRGGGPLSFEEFMKKREDLTKKLQYAQDDMSSSHHRGPYSRETYIEANNEFNQLIESHPEHRERFEKLEQEEKARLAREAKENEEKLRTGWKSMQYTPEEREAAIRRAEERTSKPDFDPYNDCFGPNGNVKLMNGESKKISEINVGDAVETVNGFNTVVLVKTGTKHNLCVVNNVVITNRHPIKLNGKWCYPEDIVPVDPNEMNVYNFELERKDNFDENDHTIIIDGLICATLGCGPCIENAKPEADKKWGSGYWDKYNS